MLGRRRDALGQPHTLRPIRHNCQRGGPTEERLDRPNMDIRGVPEFREPGHPLAKGRLESRNLGELTTKAQNFHGVATGLVDGMEPFSKTVLEGNGERHV